MKALFINPVTKIATFEVGIWRTPYIILGRLRNKIGFGSPGRSPLMGKRGHIFRSQSAISERLIFHELFRLLRVGSQIDPSMILWILLEGGGPIAIRPNEWIS